MLDTGSRMKAPSNCKRCGIRLSWIKFGMTGYATAWIGRVGWGSFFIFRCVFLYRTHVNSSFLIFLSHYLTIGGGKIKTSLYFCNELCILTRLRICLLGYWRSRSPERPVIRWYRLTFMHGALWLNATAWRGENVLRPNRSSDRSYGCFCLWEKLWKSLMTIG